MNHKTPIFFCGIGGSGMLPLAIIMKGFGESVAGSDRSRDQGRTPERFAAIENLGITLYPQDGSGITPETKTLVVSSAVEDHIADVQAAKLHNIPVTLRAHLLAQHFNLAKQRIAVAGTSGKSTTTGMIGWILHACGHNPTIYNGAVMKNFITPEQPLASAVVGDRHFMVIETDESDGSIESFYPDIAVMNNITHDHKPMEELRVLFGNFCAKARRVIINLDNDETRVLATSLPANKRITFSLEDNTADYFADRIEHTLTGVNFHLYSQRGSLPVSLQVPGNHNISNALAAIAVATETLPLDKVVNAINQFQGISRRLEVVGTANGITVIDDFAQNPDKINASMQTLHLHNGRLLLLYQPHGYGVNNRDREQFLEGFNTALNSSDIFFITDPLYLGGTVYPKEKTCEKFAADVAALGKTVHYHAKREDCAAAIIAMAKPGDRIVVMGARDDTLPQFARDILEQVSRKTAAA